jgi:hypothetical protein
VIVLPCLPVFFTGGYLTNVFLIVLVSVYLVLLLGGGKK